MTESGGVIGRDRGPNRLVKAVGGLCGRAGGRPRRAARPVSLNSLGGARVGLDRDAYLPPAALAAPQAPAELPDRRLGPSARSPPECRWARNARSPAGPGSRPRATANPPAADSSAAAPGRRRRCRRDRYRSRRLIRAYASLASRPAISSAAALAALSAASFPSVRLPLRLHRTVHAHQSPPPMMESAQHLNCATCA